MHSHPRVSNTAVLAVPPAPQRAVSFGVLALASAAIMDGRRQQSLFKELRCQHSEVGEATIETVTRLSAGRRCSFFFLCFLLTDVLSLGSKTGLEKVCGLG